MSRPREMEFTLATQREAWDRCGGFCEGRVVGDDGKLHRCGNPVSGRWHRFDHILPAALGGKPVLVNCQVLCQPCDNVKTPQDVGRIRLADRQRDADIGAEAPGKQNMPQKAKKMRVTFKVDQLKTLGPPAIARQVEGFRSLGDVVAEVLAKITPKRDAAEAGDLIDEIHRKTRDGFCNLTTDAGNGK